MRSWHPIPPSQLDRKRLLGEHRELHTIGYAALYLTKGYWHHPEVRRWRGHSKALQRRHDAIAAEMVRRGYNHRSPWPGRLVVDSEPDTEPGLWEPLEVMENKLKEKQKGRNAMTIKNIKNCKGNHGGFCSCMKSDLIKAGWSENGLNRMEKTLNNNENVLVNLKGLTAWIENMRYQDREASRFLPDIPYMQSVYDAIKNAES